MGDKIDGLTVGKIQGNRFYPLKKDGTLSNSPKARAVYSSIVGYADRYAEYLIAERQSLLVTILKNIKKHLCKMHRRFI